MGYPDSLTKAMVYRTFWRTCLFNWQHNNFTLFVPLRKGLLFACPRWKAALQKANAIRAGSVAGMVFRCDIGKKFEYQPGA